MVKPGYRQTEIGVLPESWDTITFENCFSILPNNTLSRAELNYNGGDVRNIHYGDILVKFPAVLDCSSEELPYINKENVAKASKGFLRDGDLIMADTAEDVIVGKSTEVIGIGDSKVVSGLHTIPCRPKDAEMFAPKWLGYFINHCTYHDQLIPYITGIKVSSVSKSAISSTVIAVPPRPEQKAIAEALSDIDTLIVNLEKLIAKKEAVRNGTLQRLITGRVRIEGFSGEWVKINMAKHSKLKARIGWQGLTTSEYLTSGDAILVTGTDFCEGRVKWDDCHFVGWDRYQQDPNIQIVNGDVLLTKDGTIGKVALVDSLNRPATLNSGVFVIRPLKNAYSSRFLYYVLASSVFQEFLDKLVAGSTIVHLYQKDLVVFEFMAPPTYEEQEAIASVLYDMDGEIQMLKEKLDKYKLIKQGMMSELLTGRIRLIDKEDA